MNWEQLLCDRRERQSGRKSDDIRTEFRRDYHRIIGSASFRRLQDKAQVYPLQRGDFVRTRLTHSLEVSSFAGSMGDVIFHKLGFDNSVRENCCDILECAGLVHDIGNPPFGHFGEFAIRDWCKKNLADCTFKNRRVGDILDINGQMFNDFLNFEGNAQALRVLSRLHCLIDMDTGMNLTYALLNTIVKYPVNSLEINKKSGDIKTKKMGFFTSEQKLFEDITQSTGAVNCRYPLTFILEAADDIAYLTADIEDAAVKGLISYPLILEELGKYAEGCESEDEKELLTSAAAGLEHSLESAKKLNMRDPQTKAIQRWIISRLQNMLISAAANSFCGNYDAIMNGELRQELLEKSPARTLAKALGDIAYRYAFRSRAIVKSELAESTIMNLLMDKIVPAALSFDLNGCSDFSRDLAEVLSENYLDICRKSCEGKSDAEQCYRRILLATDCISGMTDSYAKNFYRMLNGLGDI